MLSSELIRNYFIARLLYILKFLNHSTAVFIKVCQFLFSFHLAQQKTTPSTSSEAQLSSPLGASMSSDLDHHAFHILNNQFECAKKYINDSACRSGRGEFRKT